MIPFIIALIIGGVLSTGLIFASMRFLKARVARSIHKDSQGIKGSIKEIDESIAAAFQRFNGMVSLDEIGKLDEARTKIETELEQERKRLAEKERLLEAAQAAVDQQEQRHSQLKQGKEGAEVMAQQIADSRGKLEEASAKLRNELKQSQQQVAQFNEELAKHMDQEQKGYLDEVTKALDRASSQFNELVEMHELASQRFLSLQRQYTELEKEYRRLVDREISGNY